MKKFTTLLAVLLCIALALPCAAEGTYVPGDTANAIFAQVWNSGKMICGDMDIRFDMDGTALGMSEEDQKELAAAVSLLSGLDIGVAAGKIENGVRIELDAALEGVSVDAAANVDLYGITLESDLIEGQKVTAKWETLLAMLGLSDGDISMVMMLRDVDWESAMAELMSAAAQYIEMGAAMAAPYAETVSAWASELYMEIAENVEESEGYPAAALQFDVYVTEANIGDLITRLANQLKADENVAPFVDMLLAQTGEGITTAQLCDEAIAAASEMTDTENPVLLTLALDETGTPLYGQFFAFAEDESALFLELICVWNAEGSVDYALNLMELAPGGDLQDAFCVSGAAMDRDFSMLLQVYDDGMPIVGWEYIVDSEAAKTAEGQDGVKSTFSMTMNAEDDGESVQMVTSGTVNGYLTADGGEVCDTTAQMDMYVNGQAISMISTGSMSVFPTADGLTGAYGVSESIPAMGLNAYGVDIALSSKAYDAAATAALAEVALDSATTEDMNALMNTLTTNAMAKAEALMNVIPADVLNALMGE